MISLLFTLSALAGGITCQLNPYYSQVSIGWDESALTAKVETPRGYSFMPQFEAPVAPEFFPMLEHQSKSLEGLGKAFTYQWKRSQCEFSKDDSWLLACRGKGVSVGDEKEPQAVTLTTARIKESSLSGDQETLRVRLILEKDGLFFVAIPFPATHCQHKP